MRNLALAAVLVLAWLPTGCGGAEDPIGSWVADTDATLELMIEAQLAGLSPEARAAAEQEVQRIKDNVPADIRAGVQRTRIQIKRDGTWTGSSPDGAVGGTWKREAGELLLTTEGDGFTLTGNLSRGRLTVTGPGIPFTLVLRPE